MSTSSPSCLDCYVTSSGSATCGAGYAGTSSPVGLGEVQAALRPGEILVRARSMGVAVPVTFTKWSRTPRSRSLRRYCTQSASPTQLGGEDIKVTASIFGTNLTDRLYSVGKLDFYNSFSTVESSFGRPREFGLSVKKRF